MRVYEDIQGKETIVLRTEKIDSNTSPLIRVHSECITGDTFKSLRCDCGEQLETSLRLIQESKNGALIYLRQEGRGIGLFEKIKSYHLQDEGYDTFEANKMLNHKPDERTYEWAKIALIDLHMTKIRLLTNNPEKISALISLGIEVTLQIPLTITPNEYNRTYLKTKQEKYNRDTH